MSSTRDPRAEGERGPEPSEPTPRLVLGTAGHIDHGKSALVRALTGVDPDRLPEEKARGITVDLGFAPLDLPDGTRVSVVDVPGHERLVRTMVAGATGIDLVLLVVASDEGVMPQTREHLAICELLGLTRGVVALTKIDLAEPDVADLAEAEVRQLLAGTALRDAPVVRVSATTGEGLDALRDALGRTAAAAAAHTPRTGPPRLSVDRAFSMRGFGTVVTGTLVGGALAVGDPVELLPSGLRSRVRGLESHGVAVELAEPGARTAVNLQGIERAEVTRGQVLTDADALGSTRVIDARVHWLPAAAPAEGATSVEFLAGTAERRARLAPIAARALQPGARGFARIHLEGEPLPLLPGDRFVLRGFARNEQGGTTVGGGVVLDAAPPRRRPSDPALARDLEALARRDPPTDLRVRIERAGLGGVPGERLRRETGLAAAACETHLALLARAGAAARTDAGRWLGVAALADLEERIASALAGFHAREPLRPGATKGVLAGALPDNVAPDALALVLERLVRAGRVAIEAESIRLVGHRAGVAGPERALAERLRAEARAAALEPPPLREWADRLGLPVERARELLAHLEREGVLVRAPGDFWFDRAAVDALRERVRAELLNRGALETPAYKALIGTSRKHAVPLMELFDAERLTLRVGNRRVLRGAREA
jgi:selenocysteine-specific elongation factor